MENITETNEEEIYNVVDEYVSKIDDLYGDFSYYVERLLQDMITSLDKYKNQIINSDLPEDEIRQLVDYVESYENTIGKFIKITNDYL
jgi:hypothetical protein